MTLKESLETIEDTRIERRKKHGLVDILMIVFFGLLCGHKSIEAIHMVSAWASRLSVCFGQVKTEEKPNEIAA